MSRATNCLIDSNLVFGTVGAVQTVQSCLNCGWFRSSELQELFQRFRVVWTVIGFELWNCRSCSYCLYYIWFRASVLQELFQLFRAV
ncbi:hypothetical protein CEXT_581971 [Caerostris extrusa]|uniref:Uncharacterized protein n=1 Tax=Caerostris extrusa TaxID=172846 RepID=A0AAV4MEK0_CAEEX|nr:hypothetical protein CEXT_581971 [Caerostris extrusa]